MIPITKPFLPDITKYNEYLQKIWEAEYLTNAGPLVKELELKLKDYCNAQNLFYVSNGTIALQLAIKALDLKGEIITTPFSYVATTSSIAWEGCVPVFVDIDPSFLTIDPNKIEAAITPETSALLVTHVYGNPCDIEAIESIANNYNLKIIYDAAHCFGVEYKGQSIVNYGDISTLSFHATKLFQTVEGGAVITQNLELAEKISYMRNFGHDGQEKFFGIGINGKNSEFHAAMGLCNLPEVPNIISQRKKICDLYDSILLANYKISRPEIRKNTRYNYAYYPVLFEDEKALLAVKEKLNNHNIFPRRYFYPSLHTLPYIKESKMPIADDISSRVLCLPLYYSLSNEDVYKISRLILEVL
ncbi:DegT/DnrJ/EryC1/StrS family aminotransferase [Candidatus Trichorickettsia mobilis]|uniref:DegT/DnrJ/EryC1/StrS family aminotransferase n=1 Tax=Candidatus Trichorickettsia mobilis TaxID=1346319 RepID=UPI00292F9E1F|nr:DegT/DnrJ/EryC1/StrS family aminotransferase [Candidatus Trichorickettsia mobilis]